MPEYDREGGSRRLFHLLEFFQRAGWSVSFAAESSRGGERYARGLQQKSIPTYALTHAESSDDEALVNFEQLIGAVAFDVVLFAFWYCAERYLPLVRNLSPQTIVVVDSVDVQFLRESRRVFSDFGRNGQPQTLDSEYARQTMRELNAYAAADAVLTVSQKEANLINDLVVRSVAFSIPDMEDVDASKLPLQQRSGMLFVGNFRHTPNVQAVEYLCKEIVPNVSREVLAKHPVYIVGTDPDETVIRCCRETEGVQLVGWVPSVLPYLHRARISVIPLLYGAGTKRKLMQSMMVGTPCVSTSIGVEGFNLESGVHVLVADDAASFASSIVRLLTEEDLWTQLADRGRSFVDAAHGRDAVFARFNAVFEDIQKNASPLGIFHEELQPGRASLFDDKLDQSVRAEAIARRSLKGFCTISGTNTEFTISSENLREDIVAASSSSINRHRQLVCALSMALFGHPNSTLGTITDHIWTRNMRIYMAEANSVLANFFANRLGPNSCVRSEYYGPDRRSGDVIDGILHQDLQRTSFADASFDVVITNDVFEHIPDAITAEKEVMRILKPGGVYCFTVPFLPASEHDHVLAELNADGKIQYLTEPQYHSDPLRPAEGILVYRLFSFKDLKQRFERLGHEFRSYRFWSQRVGILGNDCYAHVVRKC
jgi:glycosyltransferase involved in cell wall biosynthesis